MADDEMDELTKKEAYIEGRLLGLNELIKILKDAVDEKEPMQMNALVKSIIEHIAGEMEEIIDDMKGIHKERGNKPSPFLRSAENKVQGIADAAKKIEKKSAEAAPEELKKHVEVADDLMKNLMALREKTEAKEEE